MKPRTLYLHIGCHKTGSTSIQYMLSKNPDLLAQHNLSYYAPKGWNCIHPYLGMHWRSGLIPKGMHLKNLKALVADLSALEGDVVASSENLSFIFQKRVIEDLAKALRKCFSRIVIICYIRRQDAHVVSHHQEGSKPKRRAEYQLYGYHPQPLPTWEERHDLYLNYHHRLSMWADVFGDENVIIRIFEKGQLYNDDAVGDFLKLFGITSAPDAPSRLNRSLGGRRAKVGHLINSTVRPNVELKQALLLSIGNDGVTKPSRRESKIYYEHYRESNKKLNERFKLNEIDSIFDESDFGPKTANYEWTEESANQTIVEILTWIDEVMGKWTAHDLQDIAESLPAEKNEHREKLLEIARKFERGSHMLGKNSFFTRIRNRLRNWS